VKSNGGRVREPESGSPLQGLWSLPGRIRHCCRIPTLMRFSCPAECTAESVVAHVVRDTRHAVLTTTRYSGNGRVGTEVPTPPMDLDPLQGTPGNPRRSLPTPAALLRFSAPTATSVRRSTNPGFHTRCVPPSGFLTPLTVSSLRHLPVSRTGATHGVHPAELFPLAEPYASRRRCPLAVSDIAFFCSEDQKITMPRSFRALLPARIRIPAPEPEGPGGSMLSWDFRLSRAFPRQPWNRLPGPFLPALSPPALRRDQTTGAPRPCRVRG